MQTNSQKEPLHELNRLSDAKRQSVIIEGPSGVGKTYLSQRYADMLKIDDFVSVNPKVADIREALDSSIGLSTPVMLEIENLDLGVSGAAYTLLKTLEEPTPNVYIVITCRNLANIPDTIISRSAVVNVSPPTLNDIDKFGEQLDRVKFTNVASRLVWQCVRSFSDAELVLNMTNDQIDYYESLSEVCKFKDNVSNIIWKISHYDSNQECVVELAIRSIMELMHNESITRYGIECIRELSRSRISKQATLAKFVFDSKYCSN